jgi:nucleoside-diphosphate-sugar epimerase
VVNVGSPVGITLQNLAKEVAKNFEPSLEIMLNTSPRSVGRSSKLLPDATHAQNEYELSAFTPLEEAVRLTVQWHLLQNS